MAALGTVELPHGGAAGQQLVDGESSPPVQDSSF